MTWHALRLLWKHLPEHWHKYRNVPSSTSIFLSHGARPNSTMGRKVLETRSSSSVRLKLFSAPHPTLTPAISLIVAATLLVPTTPMPRFDCGMESAGYVCTADS